MFVSFLFMFASFMPNTSHSQQPDLQSDQPIKRLSCVSHKLVVPFLIPGGHAAAVLALSEATPSLEAERSAPKQQDASAAWGAGRFGS